LFYKRFDSQEFSSSIVAGVTNRRKLSVYRKKCSSSKILELGTQPSNKKQQGDVL